MKRNYKNNEHGYGFDLERMEKMKQDCIKIMLKSGKMKQNEIE